ncbi:MAG TPA: transporter, partial [Flavisolibacter sp.]|nr:transporter [Flavisolibacter sp.]
MQQSWAKSFLTLFLAFLLQSVEAQQSDKIETDRPDQTESPYVVPKKWLQFESGFNYEKDKEGYNTFVHPTLLSKLGLSSRFELRLITEVLTVQSPPIIPFGTVSQTGLLPVQLGGKIALFEEKGARPKTSLIFHTTIPKIASSKFQ